MPTSTMPSHLLGANTWLRPLDLRVPRSHVCKHTWHALHSQGAKHAGATPDCCGPAAQRHEHMARIFGLAGAMVCVCMCVNT